jgi:hypothetical protein
MKESIFHHLVKYSQQPRVPEGADFIDPLHFSRGSFSSHAS